MIELIDYIRANGVEIWAIWGAVITIASLVVKLTPAKRDDQIFGVVLKVLNALALNPNNKKKQEKANLEAEMNERNDNRTRNNLVDTLR